MPSRELLAWLKEQGEYVRGASSSLEAPVVRRIREHFSADGESAKKDAVQVGRAEAQRHSRAESYARRV